MLLKTGSHIFIWISGYGIKNTKWKHEIISKIKQLTDRQNALTNLIHNLSLLYTGAGHIIRISSKSWFILLIPFKKCTQCTSFPSLRLSINVLGHRALWTASLFCNDLLCLALLVQGVNGRLLDNCQVSSLPHDCVAYRTRLRDHLKAFAGVLS